MISSLELAKLCGCSQGTVDRALHGRADISAKTREKVLAMAAQHGYLPNPAARELLTGERRSVGAIVPAVNSVFFMDLINTIGQALAAAGYRFFLTPVSGQEDFLSTLRTFAAMRVRLVVAVPPSPGIRLPAPLGDSLDVASLISPCEGKRVRCFMPDEVRTGRTATEYLLSKGHRRILHLTFTRETPAMLGRAQGYAAAMARHHLPGRIIRGFVAEDFRGELESFRPTAIFCHNDWQALTLMRTLNSWGLSVPRDVSILGVDDSPSFVSLCPDITTLHYPYESIAQAICAWISGKRVPAIAAAHVVERATVAPPVAQDSCPHD